MKARKRYTIRLEGRDTYHIYYKRDNLPWHRLATTHHKVVAEEVVARLKAEDEKAPASSNAPELNLPSREELIQQMLENHPTVTREEAEEMLRLFGS